MGDVRFLPDYHRVRDATDRSAVIRALDDEALISALAGSAMMRDPYVANILATEGQNRARLAGRALDAMPAALVTLSPFGRVVSANAQARALLRLGTGALGGTPLEALAAGDDDARALATMLGDEPLPVEVRLLDPAGDRFDARVRGSPIADASGARIGTALHVEEIEPRAVRLPIRDLAECAPAPWDVAPRATVRA